MRSRSAFLLGIQQLLGREHADPRIAQSLFLVPVAVDALIVTIGRHVELTTAYLTGVGLVVAVTIVAAYIGRGRLPEGWTLALPALDIVALGLMRVVPESTIEIALVFPAIWLGLQYGRRGVVVTAFAVLASFVPAFVAREPGTDELGGMAQQLLLAVLCSLVVAMTAELWQTKVVEAADAQRMLERAVADSAEQRRFNEAILNSVDVGLLALDAKGRVHSMNPRHQRFTTGRPTTRATPMPPTGSPSSPARSCRPGERCTGRRCATTSSGWARIPGRGGRSRSPSLRSSRRRDSSTGRCWPTTTSPT